MSPHLVPPSMVSIISIDDFDSSSDSFGSHSSDLDMTEVLEDDDSAIFEDNISESGDDTSVTVIYHPVRNSSARRADSSFGHILIPYEHTDQTGAGAQEPQQAIGAPTGSEEEELDDELDDDSVLEQADFGTSSINSSTYDIYSEYFERVDRGLFAGDGAWKLDYSPFRLRLFDAFEVLAWTSNVSYTLYEIKLLFPISAKQSALYLDLWEREWHVEVPDAECYRPEVFERFFWEDLFWWFIHRGYNNDRLQNAFFNLIVMVKETNMGTMLCDDGEITLFEVSPSFPLCIDISMNAYDRYCQKDWGKAGERACITASGLYARLAGSHMSTRAFVWGYALLAEFVDDMNHLWKLGSRFMMIRAKSLITMLKHAGKQLHKYITDMKDKPLDAQINETPGQDFEVSRVSTWLQWSAVIGDHSLNKSFETDFRRCCIDIHHAMKQIHIDVQWQAIRERRNDH